MSALYRPPGPRPLGAKAAMLRSLFTGNRDLIDLIPKEAYRQKVAPLGVSRRGMVLVNDPALLRQILTKDVDAFPKSDLMVDSLAPLIHDGMFVSHGETWARQRAMLDPAFTHMRVTRAFSAMAAAVDDFEAYLDRVAMRGESFSIERGMSRLTADIIYRTIFSQPLDEARARDFFDAWAVFQESVANIDLKRLILGRAWDPVPQPPKALAAAAVIRRHLGDLVDRRMEDPADFDDILSDTLAARDPSTGAGFSRDETVDQIGVFFLAGHETTASALTWAFYILSQQSDLTRALRAEADGLLGVAQVDFGATKRLTLARNVFRETLRLYPPLGFVPRVSARDTELGGVRVKRGALVMVAPWITHRHEALWDDPHAFDPGRFDPAREKAQPPGAYLPFGLGPRVCIGAAFALTEGVLILSRLARRFDFEADPGPPIRPVSYLATRPNRDIRLRPVFAEGRRE